MLWSARELCLQYTNKMKHYGRSSFVRVWSASRRWWYVIVRAWHGLAKNMACLFRTDMLLLGNGINIFGMYLFLLCLASYPRHEPQAPRWPSIFIFNLYVVEFPKFTHVRWLLFLREWRMFKNKAPPQKQTGHRLSKHFKQMMLGFTKIIFLNNVSRRFLIREVFLVYSNP